MTATPDRRVHAEGPGGRQIVRYERAGAWKYMNAAGGETRVSVAEAATWAASPGWTVRFGVPGGSVFDREVRRAVELAVRMAEFVTAEFVRVSQERAES